MNFLMTIGVVEALTVLGAILGLAVLFAVWIVSAGRRLERAWHEVENRWRTVKARLKDRGAMLPRLTDITEHRLAGQREALEVLARLRTRSIGGRNPREMAAAEAEMEVVLAGVLNAADADPGLSGLTEYETLRADLQDMTAQIRHAATVYNQAVLNFNRLAERFPATLAAGRAGSAKAEYFDDGKGSFAEAKDQA